MIILEAELGGLIPEFSDRARNRLERDGQKLVDSQTPVGDGPFDLSVIAECIAALRASILEELCEAVPNAKAGPPDPAKRAERRLRLKRLEEAEAIAERDGGSVVEHHYTEFPEVPLGESVTPKDEWELAALRLNKPELLLPGPKLEARKQIDSAMESSADYLLRQAAKRSKMNKPAPEPLPVEPLAPIESPAPIPTKSHRLATNTPPARYFKVFHRRALSDCGMCSVRNGHREGGKCGHQTSGTLGHRCGAAFDGR